MLQQTTVPVVGEYFARFLHLWPTVHDLANAPLDDVLTAWAGLGYYARARNLHACAIQIVEMGGTFPKTAEQLQKLPGIGPYTSAAIAAICFDEQVAVLDGNVERVLARLVRLSVPVREAKPDLRAQLQLMVPKRAGDFAQAMMDIGATICAPKKTLCDRCPLAPICAAKSEGDQLAFPVKPEKKAKPHKRGHAYVLVSPDSKVWLQKRPEKGLLASMTEVPGSDWTSETLSAPDYPVDGDWQNQGTVSHVFTHFSLDLTVWRIRLDRIVALNGARDGKWVAPAQFSARALPNLYRKVLAKALEG